jgi:hypothetical protein
MCPKKGASKTLLLFFSGYLLVSMVLVSFDQHPIPASKTCNLCFMKKSLCSAINQLSIPDETDLTNPDLFSMNEGFCLEGLSLYPFKSYRGPPFRSFYL